MTVDPSRRVRVTSPRTSGTRSRRITASAEIDRRTRLGEVYVASLLRVQLRLAAVVLLVVVGTLLALPLLFDRVPALSRELVLGVPVSWAVLGFGVYPFLVLGGWFYVRRAERHERDFASVLAPARRDAAPDDDRDDPGDPGPDVP